MKIRDRLLGIRRPKKEEETIEDRKILPSKQKSNSAEKAFREKQYYKVNEKVAQVNGILQRIDNLLTEVHINNVEHFNEQGVLKEETKKKFEKLFKKIYVKTFNIEKEEDMKLWSKVNDKRIEYEEMTGTIKKDDLKYYMKVLLPKRKEKVNNYKADNIQGNDI